MTTETDELLALAAKAHGNLRFIQRRGWLHVLPNGANGRWWCPDEDDGDCLRLAIKLRIRLDFEEYDGVQYACAYPLKSHQGRDEPMGDDENADMRLAVLRVAADIGRKMP